MKLEVKPFSKNLYPVVGLLIEGDAVELWLEQLQRLHIDLSKTLVYALPGIVANSVWGCFVSIGKDQIDNLSLDRSSLCQYVHERLFIPQFANLFPVLNPKEMEKLFPQHPHILHPEFGLFALDTPINFADLLSLPSADIFKTINPSVASFVPGQIRNMEIIPLPPEESLQAMEQNIFPEKKNFTDEPLNWKEKIRLQVLRKLLPKNNSGSSEGIQSGERSGLLKLLEKLMPDKNPVQNMQQDLDELERRNSSEMEKLMTLFKNDPEEALKYAIPLDNDGSNRGGHAAAFQMSKRWGAFNLFGNSASGGGNSVFADDAFQRLQQQYYKTAQDLVSEEKYEKAAFVYMKLLKNNSMAAKTLEDGKLYPEAASVYLKYLENKTKAAECYEKGYMTSNAIELYKELQQKEKVGDLYTVMNNKTAAYVYYNEVVNDYKADDKFVKASVLLKHKMDDRVSAQHLLMQGWREDKDAYNCLNNYFANFEDQKLLHQAIEEVYQNDTDKKNKLNFIRALSLEIKKDKELEPRAKAIAYEVVAELADSRPDIVDELRLFNKDVSLSKDLIRFKTDVNAKGKNNIA